MEKFHPTAHTHTRNNILLFIKKVAAVSVVLYICSYTEYLNGKKMIYLPLETNCLRLVKA